MENTSQDDGPRAARESDHIKLGRQVKALAFLVRGVEAKVLAFENTLADLRADVIAGREVDEELGQAIDEMLSDVAAGRR